MKCLSLHQPWASLLAHGKKRVETRSWAIKHRGPLLIHAAKRWTPDEGYVAADPLWFRPALESIGITLTPDDAACERAWGLPLGAIVGRVNVVDCVPTAFVRDSLSLTPHIAEGEYEGKRWKCLDIGMRERAFGDYSTGRVAFLCSDFVPFAAPVPFRGAQGLFDVPEAVVLDHRG
jgi:hypothetical protein